MMTPKMAKKLAWMLPKKVIRHAAMRLYAFAIDTDEGRENRPEEISFLKCVEIWQRHHKQ